MGQSESSSSKDSLRHLGLKAVQLYKDRVDPEKAPTEKDFIALINDAGHCHSMKKEIQELLYHRHSKKTLIEKLEAMLVTNKPTFQLNDVSKDTDCDHLEKEHAQTVQELKILSDNYSQLKEQLAAKETLSLNLSKKIVTKKKQLSTITTT